MNKRTIIGTIIAVLAYLNVALASFDPEILAGSPKAQAIYKVLSVIFAGAAWYNSHYYNQDFSDEAQEATGYMRLMKAQKKYGFVGEKFFDDEGPDDEEAWDEEDEEEEEGDEDAVQDL